MSLCQERSGHSFHLYSSCTENITVKNSQKNQQTGRMEVDIQVTVKGDRWYLPCLLHFPCHTWAAEASSQEPWEELGFSAFLCLLLNSLCELPAVFTSIAPVLGPVPLGADRYLL